MFVALREQKVAGYSKMGLAADIKTKITKSNEDSGSMEGVFTGNITQTPDATNTHLAGIGGAISALLRV